MTWVDRVCGALEEWCGEDFMVNPFVVAAIGLAVFDVCPYGWWPLGDRGFTLLFCWMVVLHE